jgi:branched-chain amino acid transport system permease protein
VGLRMRASAFAPDVSRLLGVNVGGMLTLGWALAAGVGSLAGLLVLPTELGLHPNAMDIVFVSSFTAAVVGGLDSAIGAVAGGLIVGLLLSYVSGYLGATVAPIAVLVLLVVVLLGRPGGLFSRSAARAV